MSTPTLCKLTRTMVVFRPSPKPTQWKRTGAITQRTETTLCYHISTSASSWL